MGNLFFLPLSSTSHLLSDSVPASQQQPVQKLIKFILLKSFFEAGVIFPDQQ